MGLLLPRGVQHSLQTHTHPTGLPWSSVHCHISAELGYGCHSGHWGDECRHPTATHPIPLPCTRTVSATLARFILAFSLTPPCSFRTMFWVGFPGRFLTSSLPSHHADHYRWKAEGLVEVHGPRHDSLLGSDDYLSYRLPKKTWQMHACTRGNSTW